MYQVFSRKNTPDVMDWPEDGRIEHLGADYTLLNTTADPEPFVIRPCGNLSKKALGLQMEVLTLVIKADEVPRPGRMAPKWSRLSPIDLPYCPTMIVVSDCGTHYVVGCSRVFGPCMPKDPSLKIAADDHILAVSGFRLMPRSWARPAVEELAMEDASDD
jgi:hypothetical protein